MATSPPSGDQRSFWERMGHIDRRYLFIVIAVAVIVPLLIRLNLPVLVGRRTRDLYNFIEALPERSVVMVAFDYGPSAMPELQPMAVAVLHHCFSRNLRVLAMTLTADGPVMAENALAEVAPQYDKHSGQDYVNLGYKPGWSAVVLGMGTDIYQVFPRDYIGRATRSLSVMAGVRNYEDIALVVDLASSSSPDLWIGFAGARFQQKVGTGVTAVMIIDYYPYLQTKQLVGLIGGLKGAAEYEQLIRKPAVATRGMDPQSTAHLAIVVFVLLGNVAYLAMRRAERRRRAR